MILSKPEWLVLGVHTRKRPFGGVTYRVVEIDEDAERAKLAQITDGMPGAMWVSFRTLAEKWEVSR